MRKAFEAAPGPGPGRRAVLGGALAVLALGATACDGGGAGDSSGTRKQDDAARGRAAQAVTQLKLQYAATAAAHGALAVKITPLTVELDQHLAALSAPGKASPAPSDPPAAAPQVPSSASEAGKALADAAQRSADERTADLAGVPLGGDTARLLASVAAAHAAQAYLLRSPA